MASTEVEQQPPKHNKTSVLRVSIHCEGCKRKVKKLLQSVPGVDDIEIERQQQRVVVTGDVTADTLLRKLVKAGKHAQLWPENPPEIHPRKIEKPPSASQMTVAEESIVSGKEIKSVGETKPEAHVESLPEKGKTTVTGSVAPAGGGGGEKVDGGGKKAVEVKGEEKKPETNLAEGEGSTPAVENKEEKIAENGGSGGSSGVSERKKKKKKKPVNINGDGNGDGNGNSGGGPPATMARSGENPPHHHGYEYPPRQYYAPPPAPVYTMSYNTSHPPANSYTASYYAPQPPQAYAYSHMETPMPHVRPSYEPYTYQPQQQTDSFEMFSDENPNGCLVM